MRRRAISLERSTRAARALPLALLVLAACGDDPGGTGTSVATAEPVRGTMQVGGEAAPARARLAIGDRVTVAEHGAARLALDAGARLLLDGSTALELAPDARLRLAEGRVFAETFAGDPLVVEAAGTELRTEDAAYSLRADRQGASLYVVRGEVAYRKADERGVARAGERLDVRGDALTVAAEQLFHDWTGGLARPGPQLASESRGVGVLEGRLPGQLGEARWPLVVRRLDVSVRVVGDLAITEVDQVFFNPSSETVEGIYRIEVPSDSTLHRFAVDRRGTLVDGFIREREQARQAYQEQVYQGSRLDPALLEWDAPGRYRARIYPIDPGAARRIVVRYSEWLGRSASDGPRLYRYPMGGGAAAPEVQELSFRADLTAARVGRVRAGHDARFEDGIVSLRRSDFRPRSALWVELFDPEDPPAGATLVRARHVEPRRDPRAGAAPAEDESDYVYLPLRLPDDDFGEPAEGVDLVVVADVSAATERSHLELGRTMVESLVTHLGPNERVARVASDLDVRRLPGAGSGNADDVLGPATPERVEALLTALSRMPSGGATDLGATLTSAAELLDPRREGAVVYVGDGAPTVGELSAGALVEKLAALPHPVRLYAVGVGAEADLDLLGALTEGSGLTLRVEDRREAAGAALSLLAHARRPAAHRVEVELGAAVDRVYPRAASSVVAGASLPIVGRARRDQPATVKVRGIVRGEAFERDVAVRTVEVADEGDLRLRWAGARLAQLIRDGAQREEIADLGTRYGVITPYTSFYVPSEQELMSMGEDGALLLDGARYARRVEIDEADEWWLAPAFAVLGLFGCSNADAPAPALAPMTEQEAAPPPPPSPSSPSTVVPPQQQAAMAREEASEHMARSAPPMADAPAEPAAAAPPAPEPSPVAPGGPAGGEVMDALGQMMGEQMGANAGSGGLGLSGTGRGGGGAGDGTVGLGSVGTIGHGSGSGEGQGYGRANEAPTTTTTESAIDSRRSVHRAPMRARAPSDEAGGERDRADSGQGVLGYLADVDDDREDARDRVANRARGGRISITTIIDVGHVSRRCGDASFLVLEARKALWRERLAAAYSAYDWLNVYQRAGALCEMPTFRDRRAFLGLALDRAGSVSAMLELYALLARASDRTYLRGAILERVRSTDELRAVRAAFGASRVDFELVDRTLAAASTEDAKLAAMRGLVERYGGDLDLSLRLLEMLERASRASDAKRWADRMRRHPLADAGVRTAIGEMYLRMDDVEEARRVFSEIVEFAPHDELARRRLGDLYRAHAWYEEAYRQYQTLASIRPDDPSVLLLLAQAAAGAGRIDEALRLEQRLAETAQPGESSGAARTAILWSSVRLAELRKAARTRNDEERVRAYLSRMRRGGVLREAGALRASLTWSHPDANLSLWAAHPRLSFTRPTDIAPEFGIEAFELEEQEPGVYRLEVRRRPGSSLTGVTGKLTVVWREGQNDERIEVIPLAFDGDRLAYAFELEGDTLREGTPSPEAVATAGGAR